MGSKFWEPFVFLKKLFITQTYWVKLLQLELEGPQLESH